MILNNLSEMVVRELEKDVYLSQQRQQAQQLEQLNMGLLRAMDSFKEAVMVVDTSGRDGWTVEHINSSVTSETGDEDLRSGSSHVLPLAACTKPVQHAMPLVLCACHTVASQTGEQCNVMQSRLGASAAHLAAAVASARWASAPRDAVLMSLTTIRLALTCHSLGCRAAA